MTVMQAYCSSVKRRGIIEDFFMMRYNHFDKRGWVPATSKPSAYDTGRKDQMGSLLKSTLNTRALPVGGMRYIRSDVPLGLTEEEVQWLLDHDITILVDLRSAKELERTPCPLQKRAGFTYYHLPVAGGGDTPKSREHLHEIYRGMVDEQMDTILDTIFNAASNVMYFCTAGKDRTGVVSALLLKRLGVSEDVIVEDYMKSRENLLDMLTAYVQKHPEVDIDIIVPQEENIRKVLEMRPDMS